MTMFLAYGPHKHAPGECNISIDRQSIENEAKIPIAVLETWTISGMLTSQIGATDIDAQIAALTAAYSQEGQDLILYLPDGVTQSSTVLLNASTLGGTRVTQRPSFPGGRPAERIGFCQYTIKVEAEVPLSGGPPLVNYHESIKLRGGVPVIGWLEPAVGIPVQQLFKQTSTFKATQEGTATGYLGYPAYGNPIWLAAMLPDRTELSQESPDRMGANYKNFKVSWHYEFESIVPLIGSPNPWVG